MYRITVGFFLLVFITVCSAVVPAQEKLTPALWKRIENMSPKPLPQKPAVKRESTDAHGKGLKGNVKRVISEHRSYTDIYANRGKVFTGIDEFGVDGNLVRNISFANGGELYSILVYGYIKGFRVSLYKNVNSSQGRFTVLGGPPPKPNPSTQVPDKRYTYKYEYSYENGQLSEMRMFHNDGSRGMYYKYVSSPTEKSTSGFTYDDVINSRYVYKLDDKGNEIEEIDVDVRKVYGRDTTYRIHNKSFDKAGNWTHKATYKVVAENGETTEMLVSEQFRTINYH